MCVGWGGVLQEGVGRGVGRVHYRIVPWGFNPVLHHVPEALALLALHMAGSRGGVGWGQCLRRHLLWIPAHASAYTMCSCCIPLFQQHS